MPLTRVELPYTRVRARHAVWLCWLVSLGAVLYGCAANTPVARAQAAASAAQQQRATTAVASSAAGRFEPRSAMDIINRPNRAQEEHDAWHPKQVEPLEALLKPSKPWPDKYPSIEVEVPRGNSVWKLWWMDSRFVMTTFSPRDAGVNDKVMIVDTDTGHAYSYKKGGLIAPALRSLKRHSAPADPGSSS